MADSKKDHSYSEGGDGDHAKDTNKQKNGAKNYTRSSKNASKTAEKTTPTGGKTTSQTQQEAQNDGQQPSSSGGITMDALSMLLMKMQDNQNKAMAQMLTGLSTSMKDNLQEVLKSGEAVEKRGEKRKRVEEEEEVEEDDDSEDEEEEDNNEEPGKDGEKRENTTENRQKDQIRVEEQKDGEIREQDMGNMDMEKRAEALIADVGKRFAKKGQYGEEFEGQVADLINSGLEARPDKQELKAIKRKYLTPKKLQRNGIGESKHRSDGCGNRRESKRMGKRLPGNT